MPPPLDLLPPLLAGLWTTLQLTAGATVLMLLCSFAGGLGSRARPWPVRALARAYVQVFRGTSALVQLFWFYFVLPFFGINLDAITVGILVLGLNVGAYGSEVVRGAVQAVPRGQLEAAVALNFTRRQALWRVVVPQAAIAMVPPMGNLLIELLKATALVSLITIGELTFAGQSLRDATLRTPAIYGWLLALYFAVALAITGALRLLGRRLSRGLDTGGLR